MLAFGAIEMAGPFLLLGHAEQTLPSGLTGLLVATVPLFAAVIAFTGGDRGVLRPARAIGLVVGFVGVAVIVGGPGLAAGGSGGPDRRSARCCSSRSATRSRPSSSRASSTTCPRSAPITLSLAAVGLFYLPIAFLTQHEVPTAQSTVSLVALAVLCTAVAFIVVLRADRPRSVRRARRCSPTSTRSSRSCSA